jgi:hypothetical protein
MTLWIEANFFCWDLHILLPQMGRTCTRWLNIIAWVGQGSLTTPRRLIELLGQMKSYEPMVKGDQGVLADPRVAP